MQHQPPPFQTHRTFQLSCLQPLAMEESWNEKFYLKVSMSALKQGMPTYLQTIQIQNIEIPQLHEFIAAGRTKETVSITPAASANAKASGSRGKCCI